MKTLIKSEKEYELFHHIGKTKFTGCQCIKDCTCNEDFVSANYDYYIVKKKINSFKTTIHNTLDEANSRIKVILTIPVNKYLTNDTQTNN